MAEGAVKIEAMIEHVDMARAVSVSRGAYSGHDVVVVTLTDGPYRGRGECCAIAHFGLSAEQTVSQINAVAPHIDRSTTRRDVLALLPAWPARNGLDCALWDLEACRAGVSVWQLADLQRPASIATAMTIVLGTPEDMAAQAIAHRQFSTLKLKLGPDDPLACLRAVRSARPDARLTVDANEGWSIGQLHDLTPALRGEGIALIEQPLPAAQDAALGSYEGLIPLCADESFHSIEDLAPIAQHYEWINIKLDKCGGLTAALKILDAAPHFGLTCMVGCMFATSLGIAPAMVAASRCGLRDLDGPLHLAHDRRDGFKLKDGAYILGSSDLWGSGANQSGGANR
jgi:L-Ala-D/L-Glu epimerase